MTLRALPTDYTGIDPRTGKPCHRPTHTKEAKGYIRAARRADALGLHIAAGVLDPRSGIGLCALCGEHGTLALGETGRSAAVTLELAHDWPQSIGGAVCWCSMVLTHATCNRAQGEVRLTAFDLWADARQYAAMGGDWKPWTGDRAAFSLCSVRAQRARFNAAGWRAATPEGAEVIASLRLRDWR